MNVQSQFRIGKLFTLMAAVAIVLGAWSASNQFPEARVPLIMIVGAILLTFVGIGSTRTVCWCAVIAWFVCAMAFTVVDYFKLILSNDREYYIVAYSTLVAAGGALTGLIASAYLSARDAMRAKRRLPSKPTAEIDPPAN